MENKQSSNNDKQNDKIQYDWLPKHLQPLDCQHRIPSLCKYVSIASNRQISTIYTDPFAAHRIFQLLSIHFSLKNVKKFTYLLNNKKNDSEFYQELFNIKKHQTKSVNTSNKRSEKHTDDVVCMLEFLFKDIKDIKNIKINTYLDIGCGDGDKTLHIGKNLGATDINGTDVKTNTASWNMYEKNRNPNINFKYMENNTLPYTDDYFDLISTFMVLHHVGEIDTWNKMIKEIKRCLKPNAWYVIREHDCDTNADNMLADVEHAIYEQGYPTSFNKNFVNEHSANYYSWLKLAELLSNNNFEIVDMKFDTRNLSPTIMPTRYYYMIVRLRSN